MADLLQRQMESERLELNELYRLVGERCCQLNELEGKDEKLDERIELVKKFKRKMELNERCEGCMALLNENSQFCAKCGMRVKVKIPCAKCGALLSDELKFCPRCGTKVDTQQQEKPDEVQSGFCRQCGGKLNEGAVFCANCGTKQ